MIPLIAMQFSDQVNWWVRDFIVMAMLMVMVMVKGYDY